METTTENAGAPSAPPGKPLPAADLPRLLQGLSAVFWSLPLILALGALALFGRPWDLLPYHELFLMVGFGLAWFGAWRLEAVPGPGPRWRGRLRGAEVAAGLCVYFCLFIDWWRQSPENLHLLANIFALCLSGVALLAFLATAMVELAEGLGMERLAGDFRLTFVLSLALGLVPLIGVLARMFTGAVTRAGQAPIHKIANFGEQFSVMLQDLDRWHVLALVGLSLFPVAVLMLGIWKLKTRAMQLVAEK